MFFDRLDWGRSARRSGRLGVGVGGPRPGAGDPRMKSMIRKRPGRWERRAQARPSPPARRPARSFEALEPRFLLSDAGSEPKPVVSMETTDRKIVQEVPVLLSEKPVVGPLPSALIGPTLRDDSFSLPAGSGVPTVQVDLLWPDSSDKSGGQLVVSDGSGQVLYNLSLTDVEGLRAELPIPSGRG